MTLFADRYEVLETISDGPRGALHKALDRQLDRVVALKVLALRDARTREQLLAETQMLLRLGVHPNLPVVRSNFFVDDGASVIVIDWVDGADLEAVLHERGAPGLVRSAVVDYIAQAAAALDHLHRHDPPIVHGDVKPSNLVLTPAGTVVLIDFGIARLAGQTIGAGSQGYLAPEVAAGAPCTPAADVYGLAATAYALLTGAPPAPGRPDWDGIDRAEVSSLAVVLRRALASDPARRHASAGELGERLRVGKGALPKGTVTLWSLEITEADRHWESDPRRMAELCDRVADLVSIAVDQADGSVVAFEAGGSRVLAAFTSAQGAVGAALAVRKRLAAETWSRDGAVQVQIALHTGELEVRDGAYMGPVVVRVERLRAKAGAGDILLSSATAPLVADRLPAGLQLTDLGDGLPETVFALVDVRDGTGGRSASASAAAPTLGPPAQPAQPANGPSTGADSPEQARRRAECDELDRAVRAALLQQAEAERAGQVARARFLEARVQELVGELVVKRRELGESPEPTA